MAERQSNVLILAEFCISPVFGIYRTCSGVNLVPVYGFKALFSKLNGYLTSNVTFQFSWHTWNLLGVVKVYIYVIVNGFDCWWSVTSLLSLRTGTTVVRKQETPSWEYVFVKSKRSRVYLKICRKPFFWTVNVG